MAFLMVNSPKQGQASNQNSRGPIWFDEKTGEARPQGDLTQLLTEVARGEDSLKGEGMKFPMILGGALTFEVHSCDWCMVIPVTCFFQRNLEFEKTTSRFTKILCQKRVNLTVS